MKKKLFLFTAALWASFTLSAADLYVNPVTGNDANNGSLSTPLKTIETAVLTKLQSNVQTTIHIADNSVITLTAILNFNTDKKVLLTGKNVVLKAAALPAQKDPSGLPVTGEGNRILRATTNCDLKIVGITFQNGRQVGYILGGAIFFAGNTLEVDSCKFIDNQAGSAGGAIGARGGSVIVKNSYFQGNNILGGGARGAAIMQCGPATGTPGTLLVQNCTFYQNMTQVGGSGMVINIYDSTLSSVGGAYTNMGKVEVNNCTFIENTSPTTNQAVIDVSDGDCDVYLVNNTFYKNSDCAFRLMLSHAYLANNVIVAGKQGIMSEAKVADGRPEMIAINNIVVGTEGGINGSIDDACFTTAASSNNNIVSTTAAYPLANVGLATSLSTDRFVPYLPIISGSSALINAGTDDTSAKFGSNYVLNYDITHLGKNSTRDIGAFEYGGIHDGLSFQKYISDDFSISQSGDILKVKSNTEKSFTLNLVDLSGKVVYSSKATSIMNINKKSFEQGVYILMLNNGAQVSSKKVLF
ncbi:MAG: T9SS type A sorting domain-containing protein [Bacteroidota bacterium]|nr:T9SS type A sorting domain-containing protein [Bacteroidota bacterium]